MYYSQEVVDEVLANTDIVDVVSAHVHLKKQGKDYVGLCPFHNEKTPSFSVIPGKNMFYCFGCGAGGSAITFLMKYNNCTFQEAMQDLADRAQITLPAPNYSEETKKREKHRQDLLAVNKEAATYYYKLLRSRKGERGMKYFTDRALSAETMKMFGLGFADGARSDLTDHLRKKGFSDELILESDVAVFNEKQGLHDRFFNRVMFPIQDVRGRVIGFGGRVLGDAKPKYINSSDTQIFDKGRNLYALNLARRTKADHLILCEGYMDVIAMHQAGFNQAVASLGTAFTPGQAALLRRYTKRVLLAYDSDGAGVRAALRNIGILRNGGLESSVIDLRPHKDPDEFIKAEGKEAFQARIDKAENSFFYELRILSQSYRMDDPASRTAFHREIARKLCAFADEIERDNYIAAAAEKYFIKTDSLRRLVAQYGNANGYGTDTQSGAGERAKTFRSGTNQGESKDFRSRIPPGDGNRESKSRAPQGSGNRSGQNRPPRQQNGDHQGQNGAQPAGTGADGAAGARAATGGNGASGGSGTAGGNGVAAARPFSRRLAPGPTRAQKALWEKQCLLLTWIIDDPRIFPQISRYLQPDDFDGEIYVRTASRLWDQLRKDPEAANAASVISSFETPQEQEAAAAMFNSHLEGIEDKNDREKTLRELVFFIKQASLDRMTRIGGAGSLQTLLTAKQQLQSLRSANFHL
ncbi:MAG: DNA primase [Lachnospiraceae bacterium]|nr:DNA primase [Lachnospiraceae bacterium]